MEGVRLAFKQFEVAMQRVTEDRGNTDKKQEMTLAFGELLRITGKTRLDIITAGKFNRTTVERWLKGERTPHPPQREKLREIFLSDPLREIPPDYLSIIDTLENPKYRPIVELLMKTEISREQAGILFRIAAESKGTLTPEVMKVLLDLPSD